MHKKLIGIAFSCSLIVGLLAISVPTAQASHEDVDSVSSLMPNEDFADKDQLSDQNDGQDGTAHLTALADPAADRVLWYACDDATPEAALADCAFIGQDTTGVQPDVDADDDDPDVTEQPAEAYEFNWDIPASFDSDTSGDEFDIWVIACNGAPNDTTPDITDATNCLNTVEDDIALDDAATSSRVGPFANHTEFSTGEIALFCAGGEGGGNTENREECDEIEEGSSFDHGTALPTSDVAIGFTTSDDVDLANACIDLLGNDEELEERDDSAVEPESCDDYANEVILLAESNAADPDPGRAWIAFFDDGSVPDGGDFEVAIFGNGRDNYGDCEYGGAGFVDGDSGVIISESDGLLSVSGVVEGNGVCVFDEHYSANTERVVGEVVVSFDVAALGVGIEDAGCEGEEQDEEVITEWWNFVDENGNVNTEILEACVFDQFGEPFDPDLFGTWELEGVGSFVDPSWDGGDCDGLDLDNDANDQREVCTGPDDWGSGLYAAALEGLDDDDGDTIPGDADITFCLDETDDPEDTDFGCADAPASWTATAIKHYVGGPVDIEVVFAQEGMTNTESCVANVTFKLNSTGDRDILVICTYDFYGNLVSTEIDAVRGIESEIFFFGAGAVVGPTGNPPTETGADGTTTLEIGAVGVGSATPGFDLQGADGGNQSDTDTVTKTVQQGVEPQPQCNDGVDNDGDGLIDFPNDPGCTALTDNTEADTLGEEQTHSRNVKITKFKHVQLPGKKKKSLKVKGNVTGNFADCVNQAPVKLQLRAGGEWITRKTDTTNDNGVWKVLIRHVHGKYRAVATKIEFTDNDGVHHVCLKAKDVRRHRH